MSDYPAFPLRFTHSPAAAAHWQPSRWSEVEQRDLQLAHASNGVAGAHHLRSSRGSTLTAWTPAGRLINLVYILDGEMAVSYEDRRIGLVRGDVIRDTALTAARQINLTSGFEALEIAIGLKEVDSAGPLFEFQPDAAPARAMINRDVPENWVYGQGLRDYVNYRDLGIAELTGRRLKIDVEQFVKPTEFGTGWHYHDRSEFFFCHKGTARIDIAGHGNFVLQPGDSMTFEPGVAHNAYQFREYGDFTLWFGADIATTALSASPR